MNKLKYCLPTILPAAVFLWGFFSFKTAGPGVFDGIAYGLLFFYILMPLCSFLISIWYGIVIKSIFKWLIVPLMGLIELLYITACTGDWDPGYYSVMMLLAAVPSAVGLWLGTRFSARKEARSQKAVEGGRAPALPETTESSDGDK